MREAPSRTFLEACWANGVRVQAYDPVATEEVARIYGAREDLVLCEFASAALDGADALVIATEWREFRSPDFAAICEKLAEPVIIDGRNIFDPQHMRELNIRYYAIGRGA